MLKLAVLLSGSGRTLDNFHDRIANDTLKARIEVVISNVPDALGLTKARNYGYPALHAKNNAEINKILAQYSIDLVVLAGFLKLYEPPENLLRRVLNIHPSLIPMFCGAGFYGMRVHDAVFARGLKVSGCTVHFANEVYDEGPIVTQKCTSIDGCANSKEVAERVFATECEAYPEAINLVAEKGVDYFWKARG